jgi:hypothetical protein
MTGEIAGQQDRDEPCVPVVRVDDIVARLRRRPFERGTREKREALGVVGVVVAVDAVEILAIEIGFVIDEDRPNAGGFGGEDIGEPTGFANGSASDATIRIRIESPNYPKMLMVNCRKCLRYDRPQCLIPESDPHALAEPIPARQPNSAPSRSDSRSCQTRSI